MAHWSDAYITRNPCGDALADARKSASFADWWLDCKRGDWMLWAAARDSRIAQGNEHHVHLCWIVCLIWWELAYPWWYDYGLEHSDSRPQDAISALERWCIDPSPARAARAARAEALNRIAEIVREELPEPPLP